MVSGQSLFTDVHKALLATIFLFATAYAAACLPPPPPPAAPYLTVPSSNGGSSHVTISWEHRAPGPVLQYHLERRMNGGSFEPIHSEYGHNSNVLLSFVDTFTENGTYDYRLYVCANWVEWGSICSEHIYNNDLEVSLLPNNDTPDAFVDVTDSIGLSGLATTAASWGDYDNDGWPDLYTGGKVWRNNQGTSFSLVQTLSGSANWIDYNNDGYLDLFSWQGTGKLWENQQGIYFIDVSHLLPSNQESANRRGAVWGDFNKDGYLDVYLGGYEKSGACGEKNLIFEGSAAGSFSLLSTPQPNNLRASRGITAADYDQDGDLDIYVSNYRIQGNHFLQNRSNVGGSITFTDIASSNGTKGSPQRSLTCDNAVYGHTIGSSWGDFDNDGRLDLFVGNFSHPPNYPLYDPPMTTDRPLFLKNNSNNSFSTQLIIGITPGTEWQEAYASPALADYDNDGNLDLFFTTAPGSDYVSDNSRLFRNLGDWNFNDVTEDTGIDFIQSYQAAWADFDRDGDLDLVTDGQLYENTLLGSNWFQVKLSAPASKRSILLGTQVHLYAGTKHMVRQIESATGEGNQNDNTLHFGLGDYTGQITIVVKWLDGKTETHTIWGGNELMEIDYGVDYSQQPWM